MLNNGMMRWWCLAYILTVYVVRAWGSTSFKKLNYLMSVCASISAGHKIVIIIDVRSVLSGLLNDKNIHNYPL